MILAIYVMMRDSIEKQTRYLSNKTSMLFSILRLAGLTYRSLSEQYPDIFRNGSTLRGEIYTETNPSYIFPVPV